MDLVNITRAMASSMKKKGNGGKSNGVKMIIPLKSAKIAAKNFFMQSEYTAFRLLQINFLES
jgi:hypothetical protein